MAKLQDLARMKFAELYKEAVDRCKTMRSEDEKKRKIEFIACSNNFDLEKAFQDMVNAHKVFKIAEEMGI